MTWRSEYPEVHHLGHDYTIEELVTNVEMEQINARLNRSETLPKYNITIHPKKQAAG